LVGSLADQSDIVGACRERPHHGYTAECSYEVSPPDVDCHVGVMQLQGTISHLDVLR